MAFAGCGKTPVACIVLRVSAFDATVQAGLAPNSAFSQAADTVTGPLKNELQSVLAEVRLGRSRADALASMADCVHDPQLTLMVTAIVQAEKLGSNLSTVLKELSADIRHLRWSLAEERAARLPMNMLFLMALLIFPALYLMIFGPIVANLSLELGR